MKAAKIARISSRPNWRRKAWVLARLRGARRASALSERHAAASDFTGRPSPGPLLPERWREDQAAVFPQRVGAARETEGRFCPDITLKDLAIISDLLDRIESPIFRQAHLLPEIVADAEEPLHLGVLRILPHILDIGLGEPEFLGRDRGVEDPFHDVRPLLVALTDDRADRLFRDHLGQNQMVVRFRQDETIGGERTAVIRKGIAASRVISFARNIRTV